MSVWSATYGKQSSVTTCYQSFDCGTLLASFPGPAQLSVASSTEKRERAYHVSDIGVERRVERT